jgi:hypothetical protein
MEVIIILVGLIMMGSTAVNVHERRKIVRAFEQSSVEPLKQIMETPRPKHRLIRTWMASNYENAIPPGWRWRCHCGTTGMAHDVGPDCLGSEKSAIRAWRIHAAEWDAATTNVYKEKYDQLLAEFTEYRGKCYCKNVNEELAPWREQ